MTKVRGAWMLMACMVVSVALAADPVDLMQSARWDYSTDDGASFSAGPVTIAPEATVTLVARGRFEVEALPPGLVALEVVGQMPPRTAPEYALNGVTLAGPMPGMIYATLPAVELSPLKAGANELRATLTLSNVSGGGRKAEETQVAPEAALRALADEHLEIMSGPVLGAADRDHFTLTCRTNLPANVWLESPALAEPLLSGGKLFHRFKAPRSGSATLVAQVGGKRVEKQVQLREWKEDEFRFVVLGDSRSRPRDWATVAAAAAAQNPQLVMHSGDLVMTGTRDETWQADIFGPGAPLLATTPTYVAIGNHEQNAPLYDEMFMTPGDAHHARNWSQQVGGVLLIGIDGAQDWSARSKSAQWLSERLEEGKNAKFIFVMSHYPAWSSSTHGKVNEEGRPTERPVQQMRSVVAPLLEKYKATAFFAGHDHCYERSEVDGVSYIISGGAGAPRYPKSKIAEKQNPHSLVYHAVLHYCLLEVSGDRCSMKALTPTGEVLDSREWWARQ